MLEVGRFAIESVRGDRLVEQALGRWSIEAAVDVVAIGKAAAAMGAGACRGLGERLQRALVITKTGHALPELAHYPGVETLEAGHPVPTSESLLAGARLLEWLRAAPADRRMLFLISGGASSLVEAPAAGVNLDDLVRINTWLLASGPDIDQMTAIRRRVSLIRGRNQHLALAAAGVLAGRNDVCLLAIGTDGSDGPTEDAGALVDGGTLRRGELSGLDAAEQLRRADSGAFLEASGDLISTGPTGTNVRDLVIAWKGQ